LAVSFGSEREEDLARDLFSTVELALAKVRDGVVLLLDEAQLVRDERDRHGEHPLSLLIAPVAPEQALEAFTRPLKQTARKTDAKLAEAVVKEVEAYPYFLQLWGSELWDAADLAGVDRFSIKLLDATRPDIYGRLDRDFYEPRIATLTPAEQDLLAPSAECPYPPLRSGELNRASEKTPGNVNVLLGRLVDAGALYRIRKGEYAYTAPKFREYLLRRR